MLMVFMHELARPRRVTRWYLNLQLPASLNGRLVRYLDQELDVEFPSGLDSWRWKDEDEFSDLVVRERISADHADWLRSYAERVAQGIVKERDALMARIERLEIPELSPLSVAAVLGALGNA